MDAPVRDGRAAPSVAAPARRDAAARFDRARFRGLFVAIMVCLGASWAASRVLTPRFDDPEHTVTAPAVE
jgi:hypothetical protein